MSVIDACAWAGELTQSASQNKSNDTYEITKDALRTKVDVIKNRQDFDEAVKTKVLKFYHAAEDHLDAQEDYKTRTTQYKEANKNAPEDIKKVKKELEQLQAKSDKPISEDIDKISIDELEQRLVIEKSKISGFDEQIKQLENELNVQQGRPQLIREETVIAQKDLDITVKKLEIPGNNLESKLESEAQQIYAKTLSDARLADLKMLEAEALSNPIRIELLKVKLQVLNSQKKALSPVIEALEAHLTERRQQEAKDVQNALTQAEKATEGKHILIQSSTRQNIQHSRDLQAISAKTERYAEQKNKIDTKTQEIEADFKSAEKKIRLAGLSPTLGKILREQRRNLTTQDEFELQSDAIQNETALTSLEQFKIEDRLKQLADVDTELKEVVNQKVSQDLPKNQRMMIQAELRVLLNSQKDLLNKLATAYSTYLRTLGDFDFAHRQMVIQADQFATYLDERLLWVPSSEPINVRYVVGLYESTRWFLSPTHWTKLIAQTTINALNQPFLSFISVVGLVLLQMCRNWAKRQLIIITDKVEKIYTDSFDNTTKALAYTFIVVLPWPVFAHYLGWIINSSIPAVEFNRAIGEGLQAIVLPLFFIKFFYLMFAPYGIARKHFQWQAQTTELLRKQLGWFQLVMVPGVFIINATGVAKVSTYSDSLGRLALLVTLSALMIFLVRLLRPTNGLLKSHIDNEPDGWIARLRYLWYAAAFLVPLIIIGFAVAGYYLSALELQQKLVITLRLIFFLVIFHELVIRWLTLVNRQLALKNARQRRKAAAALHDKVPTINTGGDDPVLPIDEQQLDIPKINAQTIKIVHVIISFSLIAGGWLIWKNILPAFSFLDNIELWQHVVKKDNQESYQAITLTNLLFAGLYLFIAVVSIRNFSGVMELLLFRRLSVEAGGRYAINQLAKYVLFAIGFILVANELGGSWSQVQWLVAALSVGLGFGLQEIFANLVSGIILLFERPIRVGDTVTIGAVSGKVSRIQMRATTLIDFDQKEHIVPNKTFITSQLVNWTLTDAITRIVIPISIAYGSDVELVHSVLLKTTQETSLILKEPAPSVIFTGFGESSLNFSIRIYVGELASRLAATHDLHIRLEKALRENNISIPYPQQDVHIRSFVKDFDPSH
nr:mechanosensitive ion channel domain-containing protein [Crenothrix polyspora]